MGWKFTKFTNSCVLLSLWHILSIQVGSLKTEILYLKTGSLQLTAPLSPTCKDLSVPWSSSSHEEEGLPNMTMGIWWEQFHRNYVGSENGEGKELWNLGRARGSWPRGAESQARLARLRADQLTVSGAQNSLPARPAFLSLSMLCRGCLKFHQLEQWLGRGWSESLCREKRHSLGACRKEEGGKYTRCLWGTGFTKHYLV